MRLRILEMCFEYLQRVAKQHTKRVADIQNTSRIVALPCIRKALLTEKNNNMRQVSATLSMYKIKN